MNNQKVNNTIANTNTIIIIFNVLPMNLDELDPSSRDVTEEQGVKYLITIIGVRDTVGSI